LKSETEVGKPITVHCRKMQAVTTLCRFQCGVAEVCVLLSVVALGGCLSSS